ncbi:hypothetical protein WJX81_006913 [Elliptochloris bilobata]|uniref:EF-hand domain-containing protein n=1 Tax=Elliptochloris bilobata TaxID=381761 RepID=A0AAW1RG14_9CHLO
MGLFNYLFRRLCNLVFRQVDYNGNGVLDSLEVEVAVLNLYNVINKRLPGWQDPPTRARIRAALMEYDTNKDHVLNQEEFCEFARALVHAGPDTFFARIGKSAVVQTALVPGVTMSLGGRHQRTSAAMKFRGK